MNNIFINFLGHMTGYMILAFLIGGGLGYLVFYLKYEHRDVVNELRSNLKDANKELHHLNQEMEEYTTQNVILKEKVTDLLETNDDLSKVVSELSKYYFHMKKAAHKTKELTKFLHMPDDSIEEKMEAYVQRELESNIQETHKESQTEDKSFF